MKYEDSHLPDEEILLSMDAELSTRDELRVRAHLDRCWKCRARRQELEHAIADFLQIHTEGLESGLPPVDGPRARLEAQLARLASKAGNDGSSHWTVLTFHRRYAWAAATALYALLIAAVFVVGSSSRTSGPSQNVPVSTPDPTLTPGAALLVNQREVCAQENAKNKIVPAALQRRVFEEYGISNAEPTAYEVDYLVTPALGGADDIHNLWPHSYSATAWNAQVKDALEDRLRDMVCDGSLDLNEAQREIASNWIAAYKKYFHTNQPLPVHRR